MTSDTKPALTVKLKPALVYKKQQYH